MPSDTVRFAARLRAVLGLSSEELAAAIGVDARTINRTETWSGPVLTSIELIRRLQRDTAPSQLVALAELHARRSGDPADPAWLDALATRLHEATAVEARDGGDLSIGALCDRPAAWIYWATSARADDGATRRLADEEGLIVRPLLQRGTRGQGELHAYLLALRPGDEVLLCHDARPIAWYRLKERADAQVTALARAQLRRSDSATRIELAEALPPVFRAVARDTVLGGRLTDLGYRLFDNAEPPRSGAASWFTGLAVRPAGDLPVPTQHEFTRRPPGERARITRFRRRPRQQP
ncbi:MAG: helix-turn-helix domain-containing protein [Anaeromyxobacteraceae bacterium]|nr:helix-turn-helix domain-containing protein [Anaeromyxobacteraceae bacterium]